MGVDGFSMASLGMPKEITSAQAAAAVEQNVLVNDKVVEKINPSKNKKISNEEKEKEEKKKKKFFEDGYTEEDEEKDIIEDLASDVDDNLQKNPTIYNLPAIENPENISIRFNSKSETVELYNKISQHTVDSMEADEFVDLVSNLDYNSGILVNKHI
ncbi:MAG: hypothetical protein ACI4S3_05165 [Candidatus Gastranaerophilaceae bacterium]